MRTRSKQIDRREARTGGPDADRWWNEYRTLESRYQDAKHKADERIAALKKRVAELQGRRAKPDAWDELAKYSGYFTTPAAVIVGIFYAYLPPGVC